MSQPNLLHIPLTLQFLSSLASHMQTYLSSHLQRLPSRIKLTEQTLVCNWVEPGS